MKITAVDALLLSCPLPEPMRLPFYGGERTILKRDAMIIRIKADNGLVGYAPGPAHERAAQEIRETIGPFLVGKDPLAWGSLRFEGDLELVKTYHAVEIAVIDLEKGGSFQGIIDALNVILQTGLLDFKSEGGTMIVPGHGRIGDLTDVAFYRDMLTIIRDRIQDGINRGLTFDQVKAAKPTQGWDNR